MNDRARFPYGYPHVDRLIEFAHGGDVRLERIVDRELDELELALIRVTAGGETRDVLVDNEYRDADRNYAPLWLAQVLIEFRDHEPVPPDGVTEIPVWVGLGPVSEAPPRVLELYRRMPEAAETFADALAGLEAPSDFEWSLNSDSAQALRVLAERGA